MVQCGRYWAHYKYAISYLKTVLCVKMSHILHLSCYNIDKHEPNQTHLSPYFTSFSGQGNKYWYAVTQIWSKYSLMQWAVCMGITSAASDSVYNYFNCTVYLGHESAHTYALVSSFQLLRSTRRVEKDDRMKHSQLYTYRGWKSHATPFAYDSNIKGEAYMGAYNFFQAKAP